MELKEIRLEDIYPNERNPRQVAGDDAGIDTSMEIRGLLDEVEEAGTHTCGTCVGCENPLDTLCGQYARKDEEEDE